MSFFVNPNVVVSTRLYMRKYAPIRGLNWFEILKYQKYIWQRAFFFYFDVIKLKNIEMALFRVHTPVIGKLAIFW